MSPVFRRPRSIHTRFATNNKCVMAGWHSFARVECESIPWDKDTLMGHSKSCNDAVSWRIKSQCVPVNLDEQQK